LSAEIAEKMAKGEIDPITHEEFKNDENEHYLVKKALSGKTSSGWNGYRRDREVSRELPKFLKENPDPAYMELWN